MSSFKKVVLWSKTGCYFCGEVKAFLTERNQSLIMLNQRSTAFFYMGGMGGMGGMM